MTLRFRIYSFIFLAWSVPALVASTIGTDLSNCTAGTLQSYENKQSGCLVGSLIFSGFSFVPTGTAALLNASQIEVIPVPNGLGGGLTFSRPNSGDQFTAAANTTANYTIDYSFVIDPGPVGTDADLGMDPPFGNVLITEYICADSTLIHSGTSPSGCAPPGASGSEVDAAGPDTLQSLSVDNTNPPASRAAHLVLNPQIMNFATVETVIQIVGGANSSSGFDSLTGTSTVVNSSNPEPVTSLLAVGGLGAVWLLRKRRLRI